MSAQNDQTSNPRFGFTPKQLIDASFTNAAPTGTAVARPAGLQSVVVVATCTAFGSSGSISLIVEGSNDNSNWVTIEETQAADYITANGQQRVLSVDLEHWAYIRVRTPIASGTPTYTIAVLVSGISTDAEKFIRGPSDAFGPRLGTTPTSASSDLWKRPAGTLYCNCQVVASGVVLGGLTSFNALLQGSPDQGDTWVTLGTVSITASGAQVMSVGGSQFFSLGQYADIRFRVEDNGSAGVTTAFTAITFYLSMDSSDWLIDNPSSQGGSTLGNAFLVVQLGTPGAEAANTIDIAGQIYNSEGSALSGAKKIELIVYDTTQAGDLDLASNATFTAVGTGTAIAGLTTNRVVLTTDSTGAFEVSVLDAAAESVYVCAVNPSGPNASAQLIVAAPEATLTFA